MWILGVNGPPAGWHDGSACLVNERGEIVAYAEEERFSRKKHAREQSPLRAVEHCLHQAAIKPQDIDVVAVGWDVPYVGRFYDRKWEFESASEWLREALGWEMTWPDLPDIVFVRHHLAHATSAFYASGFESAAVIVVDGNGDDESISIYSAQQDRGLARRRVWPMSHSIGWLYDATSRYIGLDFLEAGKTMGLAAYGRARGLTPWPLYQDDADDVLRPPFEIPANYGYDKIIRAWGRVFDDHGGQAVKADSHQLDRVDMAVQAAWSAQAAVEQQMRWLVALAREITGEAAVCLAGGVALNCSANGRLTEPLYVPPVPHDAGVALGAAWHVAPPRAAEPLSPYLGQEVEARMPDTDELTGLVIEPLDVAQICDALAAGRIGAIAEGRAEVGPRALCHRSIIAAPSPVSMKDRINAVKSREPWRPFGPVSFADQGAALWSPREHLSRYMLGSVEATDRGRSLAPAAVHVDGTTRPQFVPADCDELIGKILAARGDLTGGALINTSFNDRGEPIVNTGKEALRSFRTMDLDFLAMGGRVYAKAQDWWR